MSHEDLLLRRDIPVDDKLLKLVTSGLSDKRIRVKAAWAVATSEIIWHFDEVSDVTSSLSVFLKTVAKNLFDIFNEVANNPVQASQNGTLISAYAISAASLGRWIDWQDRGLGTFPYLK